jgi:hypothetical protein
MIILKKAFFLFLGLAIAGGLFAANSITLVAPNSGANLSLGQKAHIHWTFSGYPDNTPVRIVLWQNGVKKGEIAANIPIHSSQYTAGNGGYMWTVGNYAGGSAAAGCGYSINVRVQDPSGESSMSSKPFCIVGQGQGSIAVSAPNGGEKYSLGSQKEIRWTSSGLTGNVRIRLRLPGEGMERAIATSVPISEGKFLWKVGDLLDPHPDLTGPRTGLKIVVQALSGDFIDESDGTFEVVNASVPIVIQPRVGHWIKVHSPAGGASFARIGACDIAWTFSESLQGKKAKLLLLKAGGGTQMVIEPQLPLNIDDYHWNIPGGDTLPAGDYRIRLQSLDFPAVFGDSGLFQITAYMHQLTPKYSFTPVITNKGRYHSHRDSKKVFMMAPTGLETPDPGPSCCRIGWTNRCEDGWQVHWIYRSHLALNVSKIPAAASVVGARLTWTTGGGNPTAIRLYKLTASWDGDWKTLFSIPCTEISLNHPTQLRDAVQEWVQQPGKNYGLVLVGADESMNCGHAKTSIHILCNLKLEVETQLAVVD